MVASVLSVSAPRAGLLHSWSQSYGDSLSKYISEVVFDPLGNIVVCGSFRRALDIDTPFVSQGSRDIFVAKFDPSDPTILVADEPTGDLDRVSAEDVLGLMGRLNREFGKTIIMVTHDPAAAERASVIHRLDKGALSG